MLGCGHGLSELFVFQEFPRARVEETVPLHPTPEGINPHSPAWDGTGKLRMSANEAEEKLVFWVGCRGHPRKKHLNSDLNGRCRKAGQGRSPEVGKRLAFSRSGRRALHQS